MPRSRRTLESRQNMDDDKISTLEEELRKAKSAAIEAERNYEEVSTVLYSSSFFSRSLLLLRCEYLAEKNNFYIECCVLRWWTFSYSLLWSVSEDVKTSLNKSADARAVLRESLLENRTYVSCESQVAQ